MALPPGRNTIFDLRYPGSAAPGVTLYSVRGMHGTLRPIDLAQGADKLRRTINGALVDLTVPQLRKYQLEASGEDQETPSFDGLWPGMEVEVDCLVELAYMTGVGVPTRAIVPGSEYQSGPFTFYCPRMAMRVIEYQTERDEWGAAYTWAITLEEV